LKPSVAADPGAAQVKRDDGGFGWRLPALAVAVLLGGLVVIARLGMHETIRPTQTVIPTTSPAELAEATPAPTPVPTPTEPLVVLTTIPGPDIQFLDPTAFTSAYNPWPGRFADGIPSVIGGEQVHRVNETLNLAINSTTGDSGSILIGGWYEAPQALAQGCGPPRMQQACPGGNIADSPLQLGEQGVLVDGAGAQGSGPIVIRGVAHTRCATPIGDRLVYFCLYAIRTEAVVWQGDAFTATGPISVMPLLTDLGNRIGDFDPQPYHDQPSCLLPRPTQAYRSTGKVGLVFVFRSTDERVAGATALLNGPPYGDIGSGCDKRPPLDGKAGWISVDNVIIRVDRVNGAVGDAVRSVLAELTAPRGH
jgi:hypothetical protein